MSMAEPPDQPGNDRPLWLDLASVVAGEKLDRRAAFVLGFALLMVIVIAAVTVAVDLARSAQWSEPAPG
jgi:hypothetical protein